jgi:hypothetical protein
MIAGFLYSASFTGSLDFRYYPRATSDTTVFHSYFHRTNLGFSQIFGDRLSLFISFYVPSTQNGENLRETEFRFFYGYTEFNLLNGLFFRAGRQFTTFGFGNIYDGLSVYYKNHKFNFEIYGGFKSPYDQSFEIQDSSYVLGAKFFLRPFKNSRGVISYHREWMKSERDFEGIYFSNYFNLMGFHNHIKLCYDLISQNIHRLCVGTARNFERIFFSINFLDYKPVFSEGFLLSDFEIERKRFLTAGIDINLWRNLWFETGASFNFISDTSSAKEYSLGISLKPWISAGLRFGNGYQLDENFYYVSLNIPFKNILTLYGSTSYHTYEVYETEEAFSWRVGLKTGYFKNLRGQFEIQEFVNEEYNYDYRFLFSLTYKFRGRL